jgi:hypothetical protein
MWFLLFLMQDARAQAERVRAVMAPGLASQRASVQRQAESAGVVLPPMHTRAALGPGSMESWGARFAMPPCNPVPAPQLTRMIYDAARKESVDPALVREIARQESGFRPCAVSPMGAEGLMQLMPATQFQFDVDDPFDAGQSLQAGTKLLKQLLDRYHGDLPLALSAYNAGTGPVDKAGAVPDIAETRSYVMSILGRFLQ